MKVSDAVAALEQIAPTRFAEPWDNVGLLVGDPGASAKTALLTIDYTGAVAAEAEESGCELVVAYHPPLFVPLKRIDHDSLIFRAIRKGIAIYSPHTALDVAPGGTNDMLADVLGITNRRPLRVAAGTPTHCKLVTFVPESHLDSVSQAVFTAGAGRIGEYTSCGFRTPGTGTFLGSDKSNPTIGKRGQFEQVAEMRFETLVPLKAIDAVVAALKQSHPYEEPAFDLIPLAPPTEGSGLGKVGEVKRISRTAAIEQIKQGLGISHLLVAGPTEGEIERAAVCAGSCGDLLDDAIAKDVGLYLTGEMRHHDAVKAAAAGVTVVCALHSNSERPVLKRLATELARRLPALKVLVSARGRDPFSIR